MTTALVLSGCAGSSLDQSGGGGTGGAVKIGLLVPLSGVYAPLGEDMRNGFQLYLDQHGGKLGGRAVEVVSADEGEGPQTGVPAAQKLVTQDQVTAVVGVVNSATALGLRDFFHESKKPLLVANAGADDVTGARKSEYVWRTSFANGKVAAPLGPAVAKEAKGGVYLIAADYAAGREMIAGFRKTFEAAGGKVAGEEYTPFGKTQDFQPFLSAIRGSDAKAVYAFYAGAEAVSFVKQYKQFGLAGSTPLYGTGFLTEGGVLDAQGDAAVGVKTSLHYSAELDTPRNKEFAAAYRKAYDEAPTVYAVQAYDAATVLDKALPGAPGGTGEELVKALGTVGTVDSPRGRWSFDADHDAQQTYYLREVRSSGGTMVNAVVSELG
ncbi:branched-chain amino acid transport system substrate-binding protein [Nonomuraea thailandensis]|uniref:Branched-chain amino acid transport system substrate-binding protein n=1 Tax=Nonomuraea thailandensis TaxID=1188745 RepID=A0A9X2GF62_9ACTN|nr:ABC transporter substrate-binding protein [Nonomuraea thailandensis]MCP2356314.1 branched-chain amino acid transport system substrate-binding protein [Nonomuraea thailandensis]